MIATATQIDLQKLTSQTIRVVKEAGEFILRESKAFNEDELQFKETNHIVTEVDQEAERILVRGLKEVLPEATFLTEEGTVECCAGEYQWIIDPLDGTTNYIYQLPCFATSVALKHGDRIILGVVNAIAQKECFYAWENGGAFLNDRPIEVSQTDELKNSLIATGLPYFEFDLMNKYMACLQELLKNSRGMRRFGSAAIDLAYVACGRYDAFFEYGLKPWDVAAGSLIIQEAGGIVSDFESGNGYICDEQIIATNNNVHHAFGSVVRRNMTE